MVYIATPEVSLLVSMINYCLLLDSSFNSILALPPWLEAFFFYSANVVLIFTSLMDITKNIYMYNQVKVVYWILSLNNVGSRMLSDTLYCVFVHGQNKIVFVIPSLLTIVQ